MTDAASLRQMSIVRNSNTSLSGLNITGAGFVNTADNSFRELSGQLAEYLVEMSYPIAGGTANALTLTPTTALAALASNQAYSFKAASANTTAATLAVSGLTAKAVRKIVGGTDVALAANDIQQNGRYTVVYDTAANGAAGAWIIANGGGDLKSSNNLSDVASASTSRTNLGLGTAATQNTGTSGANVPLLNGANTWSASQAIQALLDLSNASAGQISFPGTQNASAGANTLDDYQEVTWTPAAKFGGNNVGMTTSLASGFAIKVGRNVIAAFRITMTAKGSSTGQAKFSGLPFTSDSFNAAWGGVCVTWVNMSGIGGGIYISMDFNSTGGPFVTSGAVNSSILSEANFTNTSDLMGFFTYRSAS